MLVNWHVEGKPRQEDRPVCNWCHLALALAEPNVEVGGETLHATCLQRKMKAINTNHF